VTVVADTGPLTETPRQYFRRHLHQQTASAGDLVWYLDQSVPRFGTSDEVRLAVEELVDRLGEFAGFNTSRADDAGHGLWASPRGQRLIVWVEEAGRAVALVGSGTHTRTRLLGTTAVEREDQLTCLYVLVGTLDERLLNEAVALRRAGRHVRLISVPALLDLSRAAGAGLRTHDDVLAALRPPSALADDLVARLVR
jgi:hypothetical protein